jgi:hypothetical protein
MFFKRERPRVVTFPEHLNQLRASGYEVTTTAARTLVRRAALAAVVEESPQGAPRIVDTGLAVGDEVAVLTDLGYQKIFLSPNGHKTPALAEHLAALHAFVEDLREALGLTSLYNEGLGTTNEKHLYDRVENRDHPRGPRAWQKN